MLCLKSIQIEEPVFFLDELNCNAPFVVFNHNIEQSIFQNRMFISTNPLVAVGKALEPLLKGRLEPVNCPFIIATALELVKNPIPAADFGIAKLTGQYCAFIFRIASNAAI